MAFGFFFDAGKCIGCRTCEIACKEKWDMDPGVALRTVHSFEYGSYPDAGLYHFSSSCNFCSEPACTKACPMNAIGLNEEGLTIYDSSHCIACRSCVNACPFSAPKLSARYCVVLKCDSCVERRAQGEEPACVEACHMRCLDFGDLDELRRRHSRSVNVDGAMTRMLASAETVPSTIVAGERKTEDALREFVC